MFFESAIYNLIRPKSQNVKESKSTFSFMNILLYFLYLIIFIIALMVAWDCNKETKGVCKYIMVWIAGMFDSIYLLFYLIYRIILGNKCY